MYISLREGILREKSKPGLVLFLRSNSAKKGCVLFRPKSHGIYIVLGRFHQNDHQYHHDNRHKGKVQKRKEKKLTNVREGVQKNLLF